MNKSDEPQPLAPRSAAFFAEIHDDCLPRIDRATVSTIGIQDDEIRHDRTGVLYEIAGQHFILTAAHDMRGIVSHNIPLYVAVNAPDVLPLPLADARFHSTEEDDRDVSAIWLPPDLAAEISKHKDFLHHNQINLATAESKGPFIFFGYPMDWSANLISENTLLSTALAFAGHPYDGDRHPTANYKPDVHILLQFSRDAIRTRDGKQDRLPHPKGISGCGIWQVGDINYETKSLHARSADTVTLIGIQHRWFPDHSYIQGTHIRHVLGLVLSNYPELERSMSIVYPTQKAR